jgi:hypothetical protein
MVLLGAFGHAVAQTAPIAQRPLPPHQSPAGAAVIVPV